MIKIIGYARVSTTKQDLSRQKLKIKEFCENNNYELIEIIEDFGISGVVADRKKNQLCYQIEIEQSVVQRKLNLSIRKLWIT